MASTSAPSSLRGKRKKFLPGAAAAGAAKRARYGSVDLTKGLRGFLVTCDQGKEQSCEREILSWLNDAADRLLPPSPPDSTPDPDHDASDDPPPPVLSLSVDDALQLELQELQQQRRHPQSSSERFAAVDCGVRGLVFVHSRHRSLDHSALLLRMLDELAATRRLHTRYTVRVHPLLRTCFARLPDVEAALAPLLATHLPPLPEGGGGRTFAVVLNKRSSNEALQRAAVIEAVVTRVGRGWTVDLERPDVVVLVEVATRMAGVGILHRWHELCKYNVRAMAESSAEEGAGDTAAAAARNGNAAKRAKGAVTAEGNGERREPTSKEEGSKGASDET